MFRAPAPRQKKNLRLEDSDDELIFSEDDERPPKKVGRSDHRPSPVASAGPPLPELSDDDDNDDYNGEAQQLDSPILSDNESRAGADDATTTTTAAGMPAGLSSGSTSTSKPTASSTPYWVLSELFEKVLRKSGKQKKLLLAKFFSLYDMRDSFPVMRLILPQLDKERQAYGMKEKNIAKVLVEHLGISKTSDDAQRLIHWKRPVVPIDSRRSDKAPPKEIAYVDSISLYIYLCPFMPLPRDCISFFFFLTFHVAVCF